MLTGFAQTVTFIDSFKLQPSSLNNQAKSYGLKDTKQKFPYLFMNDLNKINYIGDKPSYNYYHGITTDEYNNIKKNWCAETETKIYLERDVSLLFFMKK